MDNKSQLRTPMWIRADLSDPIESVANWCKLSDADFDEKIRRGLSKKSADVCYGLCPPIGGLFWPLAGTVFRGLYSSQTLSASHFVRSRHYSPWTSSAADIDLPRFRPPRTLCASDFIRHGH